MPEQELGYSLGLLAAIGILSLAGTALALRLVLDVRLVMGVWRAVAQISAGALLLAGTAWIAFLIALELHFPRLQPDIPRQAALQSWITVAIGATATLGIAALGRRSARNVAFAGSIMAASMSCMTFSAMSGLAAPIALAYDLMRVIAVMAGSATLWAGGAWLLRRAHADACHSGHAHGRVGRPARGRLT